MAHHERLGQLGHLAAPQQAGNEQKFPLYRGQNGVWTVGQPEPGKAKNPTGVWATDKAQRPAPAVPGRPVVVSHGEGRLVAYGINADGHVAYRTQTSSSAKDAPNGI